MSLPLDQNLSGEFRDKTSEIEAIRKQLLQSEKMASLGQLTAGIAHEIKNPLNFITNFSELSIELIRELRQELASLLTSPDAEKNKEIEAILSDLEDNAKKIIEHGKRADNIIRGILLHARGKAGETQPTDINTLLSEYINLGYHGMRATDNTFNIKIETSYDHTIGMINVVPQDLSRVFLNLINNSCYATAQKKKELKETYFPLLSVETKNLGDKIQIGIRDNGNGIPQAVVDKIFTPFFTTKPAGSGTGLGLSISRDIIHDHEGEIMVNSQEGEFTEFIITLPKK
jgi:signal transduction histidine kinase